MNPRSNAFAYAAAVAVLLAVSSAAATPPCPAFDYRVVFQDPTCSAFLLRDSSLPLANLFIRDLPSGNYTSLADLVRPAPSEAERVTFLDANADGMASASDAFQVWTPGSCVSYQLTIYMGANASSIGGSQGVFLSDGYVQNCMGAAPNPNLPWAIVGVGTAGLAAIGLTVAWVLSRRDP